MKTYNLHFNDSADSTNKGWEVSYEYCKNYIEMYNGTNEGYFGEYKGGTVEIYCNETEEVVYTEEIK